MYFPVSFRREFLIAGVAIFVVGIGGFAPGGVFAQDESDAVALVGVTASVAPERVSPGAKAVLKLTLKLPPGAHVNSDVPADAELIPTAFYPKAQPGITWGQPQYPSPKRVVEWYAAEPLSVFQNGAVISVPVTVGKTLQGRLTLAGSLNIQACDSEKCYPPRQFAVSATLDVINGNATVRKDLEQKRAAKKDDDSDLTTPKTLPSGKHLVADLASKTGLDFEFVDFEGRQRKFSEFRGKVVLLDFWATWCKPCLADIPKLKELYEKYKARGFEIIGMDSETIGDEAEAPDPEFARQTATRAKQIVSIRGVTWTQATAVTAVPVAVKVFGVKTLPTKILIDKEGRIVATIGEKADLAVIVGKLLSAKQ